jgi:hypothetical protein
MKKFLLVFITAMAMTGYAMAEGTDGKCCKRNPNVPNNTQDCAAIESVTWQAINTPGVSYSDALNKTCNFKYSTTLQPCVWDTSNPECKSSGTSSTPTPTPSPTPKPTSGACCLIKPNANPLISCSDPMMNLGHPQGLSAAKKRCNSIYGGNSCQWDINNPKCCLPGMEGCGPNPGTLCSPPSESIPAPFTVLATNPAYAELYKKCKTLAGNSGDPQNYNCCVTLQKDPCAEKGLNSVSPSLMGITEKGSLCCTSKTPKQDILSGNKVCCEFIKQ